MESTDHLMINPWNISPLPVHHQVSFWIPFIERKSLCSQQDQEKQDFAEDDFFPPVLNILHIKEETWVVSWHNG